MAFAKLAGDEYGGLAGRGGMLRLKVVADGGAPRELAAAIKAPRPELAPANAKRPRDPAPAGGNVNVWDKLGGGKGSSRDDPMQ